MSWDRVFVYALGMAAFYQGHYAQRQAQLRGVLGLKDNFAAIRVLQLGVDCMRLARGIEQPGPIT
jgi:hypothetical protein